MKNTLGILLILLSCTGYSQTGSEFGRTYIDYLPDEYQISIDELRDHIKRGVPKEYKTPKHERMMHLYSDYQAYFISNLITSGQLYTDWPEMENYVNKVLQRVLPEELKGDSMIHAYVTKDGSYNAYMTASGHMFVHVGMFKYVQDEATLAAVLAHELAHYHAHHNAERYFKSSTIWNTKVSKFLNDAEKQKFAIAGELEADSLAMVWMQQSDYEISGLLRTFRIMERLETQIVRRSSRKWELEETTHPLSEDRLNQLDRFIKANEANPGHKFLESEDVFNQLKKEARVEILQDQLNSFQFRACVENAFYFHLFDPDNEVFVYYLMEAIRRMCYMNPELWDKDFITHRYYLPKTESSEKKRMNRSLFDKFDTEVMAMSPAEMRNIQARFYWQNEPKFRTYEQAFVFYSSVGKAMNSPECLFSNALSHSQNPAIRDSLLEEYLTNDNIRNAEFAERILNKNVIDKSRSKKLFVFDNFYTYIYQGQDQIPVSISSEDDLKNLSILVDSVTYKFPHLVPVYMPSLKTKSLGDYLMFDALQRIAFSPTVSKGQRIEMHILDPRYLELFERFNVNEIEFMNCKYGEFRKSESTVDASEEVMAMSYEEIFKQTKRERYLQVIIATIRLDNPELMKVRYGGRDTKLKFKEVGFEAIASELRSQIYLRDKYEKELEMYLRQR